MNNPIQITRWLSLAVALVAGVAFAGPSVYGEGAMVKVRPSTPPHADAGVSLTGARNEFVSFQVVIHGGDSGASGVSAAFSGLQGAGRIGGADVALYREALLNIQTPTLRGGETGLWPDPLIPDTDEIVGEKRSAFPFDVPAGQSRAVWVDVHIPADAKPGQYTGQVEVTGQGLSAHVPVSLSVVDVLMPSTPSLATAFLAYTPGACSAHSGSCGSGAATDKLMARYQRMALEHRITLTNQAQSMPSSNDWSGFDAAYGPFLDGTAPSRLAGAKMTTVQYPGPRSSSSYAAFAKHFKEKGWFDRAFDYTIDEPTSDGQFTEAKRRADIVHQGAPDLRTLLTGSIQDIEGHGLQSAIDLIVPVVDQIDGVRDPYTGNQRPAYDAYLKEPRKGMWLYQSCDSQGCNGGLDLVPNAGWPSYMVDVSAAKNRAMQWIDFREGASGELYYQTMMALTSAWTDQYRFGGNGDGTLFYPGTPSRIGGSTDIPVASIRLKLIRQGVQDYEWLKLVSDSGDPEFAKKVAASVMPSSSQVPDDGAIFDRARLQLISRYAELHPAPPATGGSSSAGGNGTPSASSGGTPSGGTTNSGGSSSGSGHTPSTSPSATPSVRDTGASTGGGCGVAPGPVGFTSLALLGMAVALGRRRMVAARRVRSTSREG